MVVPLAEPAQPHFNGANLFGDRAREAPQHDLKDLARTLSDIAETLRKHASAHHDAAREPNISVLYDALSQIEQSQLDADLSSSIRWKYVETARSMYKARRKRAVFFGETDLFGEPAWDILLDLYIAHVEGKPVSVSSACIGSAAPSTTGLRWLGILAENDLLVRECDPKDQRRVLVRLSRKGLQAMDSYFAALARQDEV